MLTEWLRRYEAGDETIKRCVLLSGPSGIGKTSSVICILEELGYWVYEFNASDVRTKSQIEESLFNLIHVKHIKTTKPLAIVMDEIDGMSGGVKGGLSEIMHYINPDRGKGNRKAEEKEKRVKLPPFICICNNAGERKLMDFNKDCLCITFKKPTDLDVRELMDRVCDLEGIKLDASAKDIVIDYSDGDFRRLLNYLQSIDSLIVNHEQILDASNIEECNYVIGEKSMDIGLEESVRYVLSGSKLTTNDCLRVYTNHKSQFVCSMYENYGYILANKNELEAIDKVKKMAVVMNDIAWSDMIDKIMHKNQLWYLHTVHGLLSCYLPVTELRCEKPVLNTSSSRSKFNQQKNNEKDIYSLSSKMKSTTGSVDAHILSELVLHYMVDDPTTKDHNGITNYDKGIRMMKSYNLDNRHVKTLIKIDRLTQHPKFNHKTTNMIKDSLPVKKNDEEPKFRTITCDGDIGGGSSEGGVETDD
jgi:replication factor C subunit 1